MITQAADHLDRPDCLEVQVSLNLRFDDEPGAIKSTSLERHLAECDSCAAYEQTLIKLLSMLHRLPVTPFPADALKEVLCDTIERSPDRSRNVIGRIGMNLATAAALILLVFGGWLIIRPMATAQAYSEAELDRIERDLQVVMTRLGTALSSAERVAVDDVLIRETSPAMRNAPLKMNRP